jgi:hypothetical protein
VILLRINGHASAAVVVDSVKAVAREHPGRHALVVVAGARRLTLGPAWRFDANARALAALARLGTVEVDPCP